MRIYKVDIDYVKYLHNFDSRVQYNEKYTDILNQNRPYVGVVLNINGENYFAPLEHPRPSHKSLKSNLHIYKIKGGKLGIIGLNNMIPIPDTALIKFDINNDNNRNILVSQYIECSRAWNNIQNRAIQIYNKRTTAPNKFEKKMFCDFQLLEQKCKEYSQNKNYEQKKSLSLSDKIKEAQQKADKANQEKESHTYPKRNKGQEH